MKLLSILHKDFKLLFRSKSSAFTVFIGPILIIALILFAFSSSEEISFTIGTIGIDQADNSSTEFISGLENEGYLIQDYSSTETCVEDMKSSRTNLCIDFSSTNINQEILDTYETKKKKKKIK